MRAWSKYERIASSPRQPYFQIGISRSRTATLGGGLSSTKTSEQIGGLHKADDFSSALLVRWLTHRRKIAVKSCCASTMNCDDPLRKEQWDVVDDGLRSIHLNRPETFHLFTAHSVINHGKLFPAAARSRTWKMCLRKSSINYRNFSKDSRRRQKVTSTALKYRKNQFRAVDCCPTPSGPCRVHAKVRRPGELRGNWKASRNLLRRAFSGDADPRGQMPTPVGRKTCNCKRAFLLQRLRSFMIFSRALRGSGVAAT